MPYPSLWEVRNAYTPEYMLWRGIFSSQGIRTYLLGARCDDEAEPRLESEDKAMAAARASPPASTPGRTVADLIMEFVLVARDSSDRTPPEYACPSPKDRVPVSLSPASRKDLAISSQVLVTVSGRLMRYWSLDSRSLASSHPLSIEDLVTSSISAGRWLLRRRGRPRVRS